MTRPGRAPRYDLPRAAPPGLRLVQELVNTSAEETGRELLSSPGDVAAWLGERGLVEEGAVVGRLALRRLHAVREAFRALLTENNGGEPDEQAHTTLADAAVRSRLAVTWAAGAARLEVRASGVEDAIGRVLVAATEAVHDGTWARLKTCRNCRWAFYDASRNRSASWCSMQLCGNRRKTRAYRSRRRAKAGRG